MHTRLVGAVTVVDVRGRLDTASSEEAAAGLGRLAGDDSAKLLLNLDELEFLSSAGLRVILRTARALRQRSGEVKLCNARGVVAEVLEAAGFGELLHLCSSEKAALDAF